MMIMTMDIANMVDGVASAEYGWWYPEQEPGEPGYSGCFTSNVNLLTRGETSTDPEPLIGTWIYNGIPCRIRKKG